MMKRIVSLVLLLLLIFSSAFSLFSCELFGLFDRQDDPLDEPPEDADVECGECDENLGIYHRGYVGSSDNPTTPNEINESAKDHLYSDVIRLPMRGTKITFTVKNPTFDTDSIYNISFWLEDGDGWTLDTEAPNIKNDKNINIIKKEENGVATYTYISSIDGECIRFCYRVGSAFSGEVPEYTLEEVETLGTCYKEFEFLEYIRMEREREYFEILEGKTAYFIGDSLFGAHGIGKENSWINLLCAKYKMNFDNQGINGCTVSDCENGSNPIVNRYTNLPEGDADIIVIEGGRNDFNKLAKIGSVDEKDPTTYLGALAIVVEGLRERYPNAVIMAVTFWNTTTVKEGVASNTYVEAMICACETLGVPLINSYDESKSGVYMKDKEFRTKYCFVPGDVCHLNADGMKLVLPFFEREIARIYEENKK